MTHLIWLICYFEMNMPTKYKNWWWIFYLQKFHFLSKSMRQFNWLFLYWKSWTWSFCGCYIFQQKVHVQAWFCIIQTVLNLSYYTRLPSVWYFFNWSMTDKLLLKNRVLIGSYTKNGSLIGSNQRSNQHQSVWISLKVN